MKVRSRIACISAAVAALAWGGGSSQARDLTWGLPPLGSPGTQPWDTTSPNWLDGTTYVTWSNSPADSAIIGSATQQSGGTPYPTNIEIVQPITVQDLTIGTATDGGVINITTAENGSLTLLGNVTKVGAGGSPQMLFYYGSLELASGNHVFALRDTPADAAELQVNGPVTGAGSLTLNNGSYESWGTLALNFDNAYTGAPNIDKGRIVITTNQALGATSAGTTIGAMGTLSLGGAGTIVGGLTVAEPITITRNTYTGAPAGDTDANAYAHYPAAVISVNGSGTHAFTGPFVVDSTDARVRAETSTIVIASNITQGPNMTAASPGVLTVDGDSAGFVTLTGNNTGIAAGGIRMTGGVELNVSNHNNLGGPTAPITFNGGVLHPVNGFMTTFGTHPINNATFGGGIDVDANQQFTVDQALGRALGDDTNRVGSIGKRGLGTLNLNSPINLRGGQTYWDAGVVNVNSTVELNSLHLRSPVVNIGTGGSVTTVAGFNSLGQDSTGTNGAPDKATVNITGTGKLIQLDGTDFNVSDNANTEGTINLRDNGELTIGGLMHVAKNAGGKGTINQSGGTFTLKRNGNFTLVLGSRNGTGTYNMSGGTMTSAGEFYVGQGGAGAGVFNMTGGTVNQNNWFVVGREGGVGTIDISGGTFNKASGGNMPIGESNKDNLMTLRNNAKFIAATGEFWVANNGGNKATLNVQDTATLSVNDWFVVGRFGANGTLNLSGGSINKAGGGNTEFAVNNGAVATVTISGTGSYTGQTGDVRIGQGGGSNATVLIKDSGALTVSAGEFWVGNGGGNGTLNFQGGTVTGNNWMAIGRGGGSTGVVNQSGGTFTKQGGNFLAVGSGGSGTFNQTGGTLVSNGTRIGEASNGTMNLSGGTATFTGPFSLGQNGGVFGTLKVSNTANVTLPDVVFGASTGTGGGTLTLEGGTLTASSFTSGSGTGAKTVNFTGGQLTVGSYGLATALNNSGTGTLAPGGVGAVGTTAITAGYLQGANATLGIDIASGTSFDLVTAGADSVINGLVSVDVLGSFSPAPGSIYDILVSTTSLTGAPTLGGPDAGLFTMGFVNGNTLRLTAAGMATLLGDITGPNGSPDGIVNQLDLNVITGNWQKTGTGVAGDITGPNNSPDGIVNQLDLNVITGNWQKTASAGGASLSATAVPEPATLGVIGFAALAVAGRRRRRQPLAV